MKGKNRLAIFCENTIDDQYIDVRVLRIEPAEEEYSTRAKRRKQSVAGSLCDWRFHVSTWASISSGQPSLILCNNTCGGGSPGQFHKISNNEELNRSACGQE